MDRPSDSPSPDAAFDPSQDQWLAAYRPATPGPRHDGWTARRQYDFLVALAECGCVAEACRRVGKSDTSAYALRRRVDAAHFRLAWDAALDYAVHRLADAAFGRALNGTVRPVFYKGEQVGERRYFDERLTMFILLTRDPARFGKWRDRHGFAGEPDEPAQQAELLAEWAHEDAAADAAGTPRADREDVSLWRNEDPPGLPAPPSRPAR